LSRVRFFATNRGGALHLSSTENRVQNNVNLTTLSGLCDQDEVTIFIEF